MCIIILDPLREIFLRKKIYSLDTSAVRDLMGDGNLLKSFKGALRSDEIVALNDVSLAELTEDCINETICCDKLVETLTPLLSEKMPILPTGRELFIIHEFNESGGQRWSISAEDAIEFRKKLWNAIKETKSIEQYLKLDIVNFVQKEKNDFESLLKKIATLPISKSLVDDCKNILRPELEKSGFPNLTDKIGLIIQLYTHYHKALQDTTTPLNPSLPKHKNTVFDIQQLWTIPMGFNWITNDKKWKNVCIQQKLNECAQHIFSIEDFTSR